ncbi:MULTISPECIES: flagellar basal body L-ring protein FlgH [Acidiphilium]|uniref:Lipoprotein n=1 Tax=Acidiphilium iwatense TaxID=768198 RepID=A0ABS9DUC1_9PROT|nr:MULTISPECIES: hypothetical protein [Acidiphilium]MCF3946299.1 hypothetical protein [Acidiphilium iwatense]
MAAMAWADKRAVLVLPVILALAGCAIGPNLSKQMSAYVGRPESALIAGLGPPKQKIEAGDTTYFIYDRIWRTYVPGYTGGPLFVDQRPSLGGITPNVPGRTYYDTCRIGFAVRDRVVRSVALRGDHC